MLRLIFALPFDKEAYKLSPPNRFSKIMIGITLAMFTIFSIFSFKQGGSGFDSAYGIVLIAVLLICSVLYFVSRIAGSIIGIIGLLMMFSSIGIFTTNLLMGHSYSWFHDDIYSFFSNFFTDNPTEYGSEDGVFFRFVTSLVILVVGFILGTIGTRLALSEKGEQLLDTYKKSVEDLEALQERQRLKAEAEAEAKRAAAQKEKRKAKGGYQACPNCGATNWKGKRLAIAECSSCKSYFCKTCSGSKFMGGSQTCPKCNSSSFTQKGFVEV